MKHAYKPTNIVPYRGVTWQAVRQAKERKPMKKHTMQETIAITLQSKQVTLNRNYQEAINPTKIDPKTGATAKPSSRKAFTVLLEQINVESQLQSIYDRTIKTPLEIVATSITIHSLKVLARGRQYINKDGETVFTPMNLEAKKLLEKGRNDDSGILQDLIQAVTLAIWEAIASGTITIADTITEKGDTFPRLLLTDDTDDTTMRKILNVVQHEFYQNQQKHFAHEYRTIMDDDGNESDIMVTQAMREWEKSIQFIGESELLESLQITLTGREKSVLAAKLQQKQVERNYTSNGIQKRHFVTRYLTLDEIAEQLNLTKKQVRNDLTSVKMKCENLLK